MTKKFNKVFNSIQESLEYQPITKVDDEQKKVNICAWCDRDKSITKKYASRGYMTSHGLCNRHYEEQMEQL